VSNTAQILLNNVKANLDKNLIDANKFTPELDKHFLYGDVIKPAVQIFEVQANL
jgi:hypothetical protein